MAPVRIALFTPYAPNIGGAGTDYRSLLPHLRGAEIHWYYLAAAAVDYPGSTYLGPNILGGPILKDGANSFRLFVQHRHPRIDDCAKAMMDASPGIVWVDAINEGILVGSRLLDRGVRHLHVSVHDDPAGLAAKSRRYRIFQPFIDRCARRLLLRAHTVDTVSEPMQAYYRKRWGVSSGYVYRYVDRIPAGVAKPAVVPTIYVGHVGSVYSMPEVVAFFGALRNIEQTDGVRFKVLTFGKPPFSKVESEFPGLIENCGEVSEPEAVERLQQCAFVYSMYSFAPRHRIFRQTSQPTKMSTYLMAARPIFAHCPQGSSMIEMMSQFKLGICVSSLRREALVAGIRRILQFNLEIADVHAAIDHHCGQRNLDYLEHCFGLNPAG